MSPADKSNDKAGKRSLWIRLFLLALVVLVVVVLYLQFGDALSLKTLAEQETQLRTYQLEHPVLVFGIAFAAYVAVAGLSLPIAVPMTLLYGWYFGFGPALLLVSFASTAGATVAFLFSRYFFRDSIQDRFGKRLSKFNESFAQEGPFFLFTLRLIPAVPFFVINAVMGLTPIKTTTFWWVSQLGMLAGTALYVYAGSSVPNLSKLADEGINAVFTPGQLFQILAAFALLGAFPLATRWALKLFGVGPKSPSQDSDERE